MRTITITISDGVSAGEREDRSGQVLESAVNGQGWQLIEALVVPDDRRAIASMVRAICDGERADVVLTTGGTGLGPRDVTPEAIGPILERSIPGIAEAMRSYGVSKTPFAMISRSLAGVRGKTLIICFPGNPKAVTEGLEVVLPVIPHAVEILRGEGGAPSDHARFPHHHQV